MPAFYLEKGKYMSNFEKTLENLNNYLINNKEEYEIYQKIDSSGFVVIESVQDLTCFITCDITDRCKCLSLAIHLCITCLKSEKEQLREYFEEINNMFYLGQLLLNSEGAIYIQVSQKYIDAPLSVETIAVMFLELYSILEFTLPKIKEIVYKSQNICYET